MTRKESLVPSILRCGDVTTRSNWATAPLLCCPIWVRGSESGAKVILTEMHRIQQPNLNFVLESFLKCWCVRAFQLQGGTKQQNGCVKWTTAHRQHCPKKPPRKSSALHFAMASFSATSSTKSIPALFSRLYSCASCSCSITSNTMLNFLLFFSFLSNYFHHVSICLHEFQTVPWQEICP